MRERGIPLIPFRYCGGHHDGASLSAAALVEQFGLPVVVKPLRSSGGRGVLFAGSAQQLEPWLERRVLFEKFVDAPEVSVESVVGDREIRFESVTQYVEKRLVNLVPSGHPAAVNARVLELNRRVLGALDIEWGLTHAEYYLAGDEIFFGEIAIRPPGGYIMDLIGLSHDFDAWGAFVDNELGLKPSFGRPLQVAASALFHPGAGVIEAVTGVEAIRSDPLCRKLHLYAKAGDTLGPRDGVSEAAAFALFCGASQQDTLASVRNAQRQLQFRMAVPLHRAPSI
jgi:formate-dependent phosphoribosylglycinamide formyltransferase (GAR transformylase)